MTLHQFMIFSAIARRGNVTKAGWDLHLSQPAITHQMKQLQESYGATLYQRTPSGIALTPAGERLLVGIGPILEMVGKLRSGSSPGGIRKASRAVLRVGGIESASASLLPGILAQFKRRHDEVEIDFRTQTSEHLERLVLNFAMDLAVTGREPRSEELICEPLRRERVAMFVPATHPLAKKGSLTLSEVLAEPLIVRGGRGGAGVTDSALQHLRELGQRLNIGMLCDGPTAIKAGVRHGMGVGIMFAESLKAEVASGEFKILSVAGVVLQGESFIVYSKDRPLSPLASEFLELLRREGSKRRDYSGARRAAQPNRLAQSGSVYGM